jgi:two-component system, LytTR family, response regulator
MIRTVLVDDETDSIRMLQRLLETYCPNVSIVGKADGVESGLESIRATWPDLVFLDIEMTEGNAFDLLNRLMPINFQVIFVTAFDSYAVRGFKYNAVDYLMKPIDIGELKNAVNKVTSKTREESETSAHQMKTVLESVGNFQLSQQKMGVPTLTGLIFVAISEIIRFEAKGRYTSIYLDNGEVILAARTIKEYEELVPETNFFRIHNSHIICLQKIRQYHKGRGGYVVMQDGEAIDVASRRRMEFLQRLLK